MSIRSSLSDRRAQQRKISTGIGARVSGLRREKGLRVADLAGLVGVSPSLISQIERGRTAPSVATLFMLAKALAVPVDDLFEEVSPGGAGQVPAAAAPSGTVERAEWKGASDPSGGLGRRYLVRKNDRATLDVRGGVQWERLTSRTLGDVEFLELVYSPRAESDAQLYRHPGWEMVVVLSGRLDIYVGFECYELNQGDSISFPSSRPHRYANPTDQTARAISVILSDAACIGDDKGVSSSPDAEEPSLRRGL